MSIDGVVLYTDGSSRLGNAGWGLHGYTYSTTVMEKAPKGLSGKDLGGALPTSEGYKTKDDLKDSMVTPIDVIDGWGSILIDRTNNHGELLAMHRALSWLAALEELPAKIRIYADSEYVIKALTVWIADSWIKNKWKGSNGKPIAHREKWEAAFETYNTIVDKCPDFKIEHIDAHAGHFGNETADQLAKLGSGSNVDVEYLDTTPYQDWLACTTGNDDNKLHPLIMKGGMFFEIGVEERSPRYFLYHLRGRSGGNPRTNDTFEEKLSKRDVYLGTWVSDQVYAVVELKEREPLLDKAMALHESVMGSGYAEFATMRLDYVTRKAYVSLQRRLGEGATYQLPNSLTLVTVKDQVISRTLRPPLRAFDAAQTYDSLDHKLTQFIQEEVDKDVHVIDITDRLFEPRQKSPKAKVEWKTREDISSKATHIAVKEEVEGSTFYTKLIFGTDLPERQALGRIASESTKVYLHITKRGIRFIYDVFIRTDEGYAVFTSPDKMVFAKE